MASGHVLYAEALGAESLVHVKLDSGELVTMRLDGAAPAAGEGETIAIAWDRKAEALFGKDGKRL